jgi:hypothetical protein
MYEGIASKMEQAKSSLIRKMFIEARGAEVLRKFHPPFREGPLKF